MLNTIKLLSIWEVADCPLRIITCETSNMNAQNMVLTLLRCQKGANEDISKGSSGFTLCNVNHLISFNSPQLPYVGTPCYLCMKWLKGSYRRTSRV